MHPELEIFCRRNDGSIWMPAGWAWLIIQPQG